MPEPQPLGAEETLRDILGRMHVGNRHPADLDWLARNGGRSPDVAPEGGRATCPSGCGCIWPSTDEERANDRSDADARDCACDGPCCFDSFDDWLADVLTHPDDYRETFQYHDHPDAEKVAALATPEPSRSPDVAPEPLPHDDDDAAWDRIIADVEAVAATADFATPEPVRSPEVDGLREALLRWYETTHGNEFGHDHHCPAPWNDEPHTQPIFDGCTCGWSDVQRAEQARAALTGDDPKVEP